jgi:hypothetical protein
MRLNNRPAKLRLEIASFNEQQTQYFQYLKLVKTQTCSHYDSNYQQENIMYL